MARLRKHLRIGSTHEQYVRRVVEESQIRDEDIAEGILVEAYAQAVTLLSECPEVGLSPQEAVRRCLDCQLRARGRR